MSQSQKFRILLDRWTSPPPNESRAELQYWQERILYSFLLIGLVFGLIALIPGVMLSIKEKLWVIALLDVMIYLWAIVLFFYRKLPYGARAFSCIGLSYVLGLELLLVIGPFGGGPVWLFFFPIITGLLTKLRYAIISLLINVLTVSIFSLLIAFESYQWSFIQVHTTESWIVMVLNFLLMNFIATVAVCVIVQGLQKSLIDKKKILESLERNNEELRISNKRLVDEMNLRNQTQKSLQKSETARTVAEKTNKAISEWVNFIAHEIRSPIGAPLNYSRMGLQLLKTDWVPENSSVIRNVTENSEEENSDATSQFYDKNDALHEEISKKQKTLVKYFERIFASAERLNHLLNELLDLSKLESGQMSFSFRQADVVDVVNETLTEFEASLLEKNIVLDIGSINISTEIECDVFRLGQVMRNLMSNAIKFTPEGKKIMIIFDSATIRMGRRIEDKVVPALKVSVINEGEGIPEGQMEEIFEKFRQSRKSRQGEGTGLGLPICREIIAAHNGWIKAYNEENQRVRFSFALPFKQLRVKNDI